jgi:hypothetical protein
LGKFSTNCSVQKGIDDTFSVAFLLMLTGLPLVLCRKILAKGIEVCQGAAYHDGGPPHGRHSSTQKHMLTSTISTSSIRKIATKGEIMSTLDQIGERVTKVEKLQESHSATLDILANNQIELVKITARLDKSIGNHEKILTDMAKIIARLDRSHAEHEVRMAVHEDWMANHEKKMAEVGEGLQEMRRFNRQTLRLYLLIARKANWLDEDDIREWENDND